MTARLVFIFFSALSSFPFHFSCTRILSAFVDYTAGGRYSQHWHYLCHPNSVWPSASLTSLSSWIVSFSAHAIIAHCWKYQRVAMWPIHCAGNKAFCLELLHQRINNPGKLWLQRRRITFFCDTGQKRLDLSSTVSGWVQIENVIYLQAFRKNVVPFAFIVVS